MNSLEWIDSYGDGTFDIHYLGPFAEVRVMMMGFENSPNITLVGPEETNSAKVGLYRVRVRGSDRYPMTTIKIARLTGLPLASVAELTRKVPGLPPA